MYQLIELTSLDNPRRKLLLSFYSAALTSTVAMSIVNSASALRTVRLVFGTVAAAIAVWFLLRFLYSNDERERHVNYCALTFGFCGTLVFSLVVGLFQSASFHSISWLGIPPLMTILWSIGLILYSWRYR